MGDDDYTKSNNAEFNFNINLWELENIINKITDINKDINKDININSLPVIDVNLAGSVNNIITTETVIRDERTGIERTRIIIETLLSAITNKDAKAVLIGGYSALNNALEQAYILLNYEIQNEIEKLQKKVNN